MAGLRLQKDRVMTHYDKTLFFRDVLQCGAFLRKSENEWLIWSGLKNGQKLNKNQNNSISYMNFYESQLRAFNELSEPQVMTGAEFSTALKSVVETLPFQIKQEHFRCAPFADFEKTLQIIQGKIQRGEIEKAVPVVFAQNENQPTWADRIHWIENLMKAPKALHLFGFWNEHQGIIGATPEILFHRHGKIIHTMALAGTCPRSEIASRVPLLKDAKELHEHELVVKDLEQNLKTWGWVKKSETKILELPTLLHLQTELSVEARPKSDEEIIRQLHPTPALGVAPRAYGYRWMEQFPEQKDRGLFGGPVLFSLSKEESLCLVAIRNIQWNSKGCKIGTGCGVVAASEAEREWRELDQKRQSVYSLFGIL